MQEFIQPYVTSITSMEADHVFEAAKDAGGARVIEAFLGSKVSAKQKHRLVLKYVMLLYLVSLFNLRISYLLLFSNMEFFNLALVS